MPKVLAVDDDALVLNALRRSLTDYEVNLSQNPSQALDLLEKNTFDILITDFRMPGMDGVDLLEKARALQPDILAVILTGYSDEKASKGAWSMPGVYKVNKPWADELGIVLKRALEFRETRNALREDLRRTVACMNADKDFALRYSPEHLFEHLMSVLLNHESVQQASIYLLRDETLNCVQSTEKPEDIMLSEFSAWHDCGVDNPKLNRRGRIWEFFMALGVGGTKQGLALLKLSRVNDSEINSISFLIRQCAYALNSLLLLDNLRNTVQELRGTQHQLLTSEKLLGASFLAESILRRLNDPICVIHNYLQMFRLKGGFPDGRESSQILATLENATTRIMEALQEIHQTGTELTLKPKQVQLEDLLRSATKGLNDTESARKLKIQIESIHCIPLLCDPDQITLLLHQTTKLFARNGGAEGTLKISLFKTAQSIRIRVQMLQSNGSSRFPSGRKNLQQSLEYLIIRKIVSAHKGFLEDSFDEEEMTLTIFLPAVL